MYYKWLFANQWWAITEMTQHWIDGQYLQSRPPSVLLRWWINFAPLPLLTDCPCSLPHPYCVVRNLDIRQWGGRTHNEQEPIVDLVWIFDFVTIDSSIYFLTEPILHILCAEFYFFSKIVIYTSIFFSSVLLRWWKNLPRPLCWLTAPVLYHTFSCGQELGYRALEGWTQNLSSSNY